MKAKLYIYIYVLTFLASMSSCNEKLHDDMLERALAVAGNNRAEMEYVLSHYANDSLKLAAAKFLIGNMPGHYSYCDTNIIVRYSVSTDSTIMAMEKRGAGSREICDSVNALAEHLGIASLERCPDIRIMKAKYLINNIDDAFDAWENGKWARHLGFDDFCEYLLPYKVKELQLLDDWRSRLSHFETENMKNLEWCDGFRGSTLAASRTLAENYKNCINPNYDGAINYQAMKWEVCAKMPSGTCDYYAPLAVALYRSNGIPVCHDFTPHWACRRLGHSWNVMIGENGYHYTFNGICDFPGYGHNVYGKISKVYRHTYAINEELFDLNQKQEMVPSLFRTYFIKDVTREYLLNCVDVTIKAKSLLKNHKYAFLAIFGDKDWSPFAYGKVENGKVEYKDLGRNTMYLPFVYDDGKMVALSSPFVIETDGKKRDIKTSHTNETITLKRKYPALDYVYRWLGRLDSCEFQASNDPDFKNKYVINRISDCHAYGHKVEVADSIPPCRYWRFYSMKSDTHANIAELYFYNKQKKQVKGKVIGTDGSWEDNKDCTRDAVADGDILSFFDAPYGYASWVGVDFGKPVDISYFYYYARGDGNAVEIGDLYELFFWDEDKWKSLGKKEAFSPSVTFENVPRGAVLLLKDLSKGQEERVFTYEHGKQVWW